MSQQTRKDPRAKVLSMTVRYKSATLDEFIEHHSHDVSRGGMFIKTPQPFPPGTLLKFEVRIAEDVKVMQGVGRVVWKRDASAGEAERPAGMGVKFIKLDDESRRLIDQLLISRKDEPSSFDAERAQTVSDSEAPVGLGTETLSSPPPSKAPPKYEVEPAPFFPRSDPLDLPPPEDRTVMKQASELLEEALREVNNSTGTTKQAALTSSLIDEKEVTRPGRPQRAGDSLGRVPATNSSAAKAESPLSSAKGALPLVSERSKPSSASSLRPVATPSVRAPAESELADKAALGRGITELAREVSTSKTPSSMGGRLADKPKPAVPMPPRPAVPAQAAKEPSQVVAAAPLSSATRPSSSGRAIAWFLAVAACAAGTWWLWRPRPVEPPSPESPAAANEALRPVQNPQEIPAVVAPSAAPESSAAPSASQAPEAPTAEAAATGAPSSEAKAPPAAATTEPAPQPKSEATAVPQAKPVMARKPKPAAPIATDEPVSPSPVAEPSPAAAPAEQVEPTPKPAATPEPPATPPPVAATPAPAAPAPPPTAAPAPTPAQPPTPAAPTAVPAQPPATPAPAAAKGRKTPAADSDNPY